MLWRAFSMVASQKAAMQSGFTCAKTWTMNMSNLPYKRSDTQERNWQSDRLMRASQRGVGETGRRAQRDDLCATRVGVRNSGRLRAQHATLGCTTDDVKLSGLFRLTPKKEAGKLPASGKKLEEFLL